MLNRFLLILLSPILFVQGLLAYDLGIITMFKNEAPYIREWVEYHNMIGVDHFWMFNNMSDDNWEEVLAPYISKGLVEVIDWPLADTTEWWGHAQIRSFKEGINRANGAAKWVAMIDIDEFLVPMKETNVVDCLNKHFANASAIYVNWRNFGTGGVTVPNKSPFLFSLTACSIKNHPHNGIGKSIVRPDRVEDCRSPHHCYLLPGFVYQDGSCTVVQRINGNLAFDGYHHDKYIRINHYILRDEWYFLNKRLPKVQPGTEEYATLLEHYDSFQIMKDNKICNLIKNTYPVQYQTVWNSAP